MDIVKRDWIELFCGKYIHNKTGNYCVVINIATDCTNVTDGRDMVLYQTMNENYEEKIFCREYEEFIEKFTKVNQ